MIKKVNLDGETYIVSEDVDFDRLDTDNMVEKNIIIPESNSKFSNVEQHKTIKVNQQKRNKTVPPNISFHFNFLKRKYMFKGYLLSCETQDCFTFYKVKMSAKQAMQLFNLKLRTQGKYVKSEKPLLLQKTFIEFNNNKFEFLPIKGKKGLPLQKLSRVQIKFSKKKTIKEFVNIEIEFVSIHWG